MIGTDDCLCENFAEGRLRIISKRVEKRYFTLIHLIPFIFAISVKEKNNNKKQEVMHR